MRYKNPAKEKFGVGKGDVLFNEEALYMQDTIYLTEGWADAATMGKLGVSTQGLDLGIMQTSMIIQSPVKEVIIVTDAGQYRQGLKQAEKLYRHKICKVLDLKMLSEYGKDINEIGKDKVLSLDAYQLTFNTLYKGLKNA